jgi:hypothetical protein
MLQLNQWVVSVPIIWIWLALPSGNASKPSRLQIRPPRWPLSQLAKPTTQQLYVTIHNLKVRGGGAPQSNSGSFVGGRISLDNSVPPPCNDNHSTILANAEGETNVYNSDYAPTAPINYDNVPDQQEQQQEDEPDPFHETVQERVDQWRTNLQQHSAELQASPRDEQGRSKLLVSVSRGSRVFIFVLLMLRDLHLYETASQVIQPAFLQGLVSSFLVIMFIANMTGVVACYKEATQGDTEYRKIGRDRHDDVCSAPTDGFPESIHTERSLCWKSYERSVLFVSMPNAYEIVLGRKGGPTHSHVSTTTTTTS